MLSKRAFTLLELSIALAIAGLVAAAALTATVSLQKSLTATRKMTEIADDARFTLEHVVAPVRTAGGGGVRPWQAVSTTCRDDPRFDLPVCDVASAARLHVATVEPAQCKIESVNAGLTTLTVARAGGSCCLANFAGGRNAVVLFPPESMGSTHQGPAWRARHCTLVPGSTTAGAGPCGCALDDTLKVGFDVLPPVGAFPASELVGGTIARARVRSFFYRPLTRHLMALSDISGLGIAESTELTPRVTRFSARLGYDTSPVDGVVEPLVLAPVPASLQDLRLVRVGLAISARVANDRQNSAAFFGAPISEPGRRVVVAEGNAVMRATGVFQ
ncbi:MAG: prepilin-type N-terminal cleavage/methylation domain-containing protein [Deltaproteobacteria bacterium]|nr:prepilin-type N-terminal cleavage/methylation domain-containing protein [Deltaproteobacteria bacterium]